MRDAKTILNIIRERGQRGLPVENVYRLLYNPDSNTDATTVTLSNVKITRKRSDTETVMLRLEGGGWKSANIW